MINFNYVLKESLPCLAWVATFDFKIGQMVVCHGIDVEVHKSFFVEGVWDGNFIDGEISNTDCFFGTASQISNNRYTFIASTSTTDYLYYKFIKQKIFQISNSLPLLLAHSGDKLDHNCFEYEAINESITSGIYSYEIEVPSLKGGINRLIHNNLVFTDGDVSIIEKPMPIFGDSFDEYRDYIIKKYELLVQNAEDENRRQSLSIISTQSRGYDSTAVNAIASSFKVDNVFSIKEAKERGTYVTSEHDNNDSDDGTNICMKLGLPCTLIERKAYQDDFSDEYLYYSGSHLCEDANLKGIHEHINKVSLLLTGNLGEIWYTEDSYYEDRPNDIDTSLKRWDLGGHGLSEIRIKEGFIQLPLPFIGARNRETIFNITHSAEMKPWRLNNKYDRPIPRRIAEEKGVAREDFGQKKMATVTEFPMPPMPIDLKLNAEYKAYLKDTLRLSRFLILLIPFIHKINARITFSRPDRYRYVYYTERLISKIINKEFKFTPFLKKYNGSLFCFCVNKRADEFRKLTK